MVSTTAASVLDRCIPADGITLLADSGKTFARLPFDTLREQYAGAVRAGLIERSLIASAGFERKLGAFERSILGPWARSR